MVHSMALASAPEYQGALGTALSVNSSYDEVLAKATEQQRRSVLEYSRAGLAIAEANRRQWCQEHQFSMATVIRGLVSQFLEKRGLEEQDLKEHGLEEHGLEEHGLEGHGLEVQSEIPEGS